MRIIASIFFLSVFLFNWFGYRLLSSLLEEKATTVLMASLDNDKYNDADLVSIKLPSNLPYYPNSNQFNRMDGEIDLNGIHYNFVKCRIYKDSVEYLCILNNTKTKLTNARDEFFKLVNDLQHPFQNKKSGNTGSIKNLLSEYCQDSNTWSFSPFLPIKSITTSLYLLSLSKPGLSPLEFPPDAC